MNASTMSRLLAVDDDPVSAELIVRVAERCGYEAFATSDSRGVVNLAKALQPNIIAVDIQMPNVDAPQLFCHMASAGIRAKILIVSGQDTNILEDTRDHAESLGLSVPYVLQKPVDFKQLRDMLTAPEVRAVA